MSARYATQVIKCPIRHRQVEVCYSVAGGWFNRDFKVESCAAMYDAGPKCDKRCVSLLRRPSISFLNDGRM